MTMDELEGRKAAPSFPPEQRKGLPSAGGWLWVQHKEQTLLVILPGMLEGPHRPICTGSSMGGRILCAGCLKPGS